MLHTLSKSKLTYIIVIFYILLALWWMKIFLSGQTSGDENLLFGFAYSFIALIGGINGLITAQKWGGFKSLMGRGISFLSIGLLGYWFGQVSWSYYNFILHVEVPYPSIADIGYFSVIPLYTIGMLSFAQTAGAGITLRKLQGKLIVFILPLISLTITYYLFLKNLSPDFTDPIRTFLDYGTPLGYAIVISMALTAYALTADVLGGKMKSKIMFIIFALIAQNITDNTFLYQAAAGTYYNGGVNDLMFATTFMLMSIGLIGLKSYE